MKTKDYTPTCCDEKSVRNEVLGKSFYYCRVCKFETADHSYAAEARRREIKEEREQEPLQRYGYRPTPVAKPEEKPKGTDVKQGWFGGPYPTTIYNTLAEAFAEYLEGDAAKTHWYAHWKEFE